MLAVGVGRVCWRSDCLFTHGLNQHRLTTLRHCCLQLPMCNLSTIYSCGTTAGKCQCNPSSDKPVCESGVCKVGIK